jgi:hypothetical protein
MTSFRSELRDTPALMTLVGIGLCAVLAVYAQWRLFSDTQRDGHVGRALWQQVAHRQRPQDPAELWYQVPAALPKSTIGELPADVARRATPVLDWLIANDNIQAAGTVRMLLLHDQLTIELSDLDEAGCRRIITAARSEHTPIASIGLSGSDDMIAVPTRPSDEESCTGRSAHIRINDIRLGRS